MPGPSLDRIRAIAELLDHPELTYPSVHVTGTNGKTTTARLVSALACAHGLSTGTYLSPHLRSVNERLSICGVDMTESEFAEEYTRLVPYHERVDAFEGRLTYFETLTAIAYLWFADKPVGLGVFEVGMGGAWDATNLILGDVAVLCPIGLDHTAILGTTVREIATEKAGIIKEGRVAIAREQRDEAMTVIRARCEEVGATLALEGEAFELDARGQGVGGQSLTVRGLHASYDDLFLPVFGEQTARNAAASIAAVEALFGRALNPGAVRATLSGFRTPGRLEVIARHPLVILDGAHNPDAAAALATAIAEAFRWERLHLVIAMFGDKDVETVTGILGPVANAAYATPNASPRSAPADRLAAGLAAAGVDDVRTFDSVADAVSAARVAAADGDLIVVTGSLYTVADARPLFTDPEHG
ncbi:MAG: dihydrofolate synthase [Actinobacteria bacterium]|nr:MAG: dihydrofolate synthase [Actinomycetota bacterium]